MPRTITPNWIDWVMVAIVLVSILRGTRFGVLAGLVDLAGLIATYLAAAAYYPEGAAFLHRAPMLPAAWESLIAFLVIWLALYVPLGMLIRWTLGGARAPLARLLGGIMGGVRGTALVTILLLLALAAPFRDVVAPDARRAQAAPYLLQGSAVVERTLLPHLPVRVARLGPGGTRF